MSLFRFLVADYPIKEVDYSGITEITVRELKKLYPITENTPEQPWHTMDDDAKVLHAPDESAFGKLGISLCQNPPQDLFFYTDKEHVYWLEGNWNEKFLYDFTEYIKVHLKGRYDVDLISFWAGDVQRLEEYTIYINEIEQSHLEKFKDKENIRVQFIQ